MALPGNSKHTTLEPDTKKPSPPPSTGRKGLLDAPLLGDFRDLKCETWRTFHDKPVF